MKPLILQVIADSSQTGAPRLVLFLASGLSERYDVRVLCPAGWLAEQLKERNVPIHLFDQPTNRHAMINQCARVYAEQKPAIIHCHGVRGGVVGRLATSNAGAKRVYTEHLWTKEFRLPSRLRQMWQLRLLKQLNQETDAVVGVSRAVVDFLTSRNLSQPAKTSLIYGAIEPIEPAKRLVRLPIIGTIGTLTWVKGVDRLLRALPAVIESYPNLVGKIAGDGPEKAALIALAEQLQISEHLEWLGNVDDPAKFYRSLQLYIQPSLSESFGLAVLEAMSAQVSVIAAKTGALPEIIEDGVDGLLFSDEAELRKKLLRLLGDDQERHRLALAGQTQAARFSLERMVNDYDTLYQRLLL